MSFTIYADNVLYQEKRDFEFDQEKPAVEAKIREEERKIEQRAQQRKEEEK